MVAKYNHSSQVTRCEVGTQMFIYTHLIYMHIFAAQVHMQINERRAWEQGQSKGGNRENSKIPSNKNDACLLNFGILLLYYFKSMGKLIEKNVHFLANILREIKNRK